MLNPLLAQRRNRGDRVITDVPRARPGSRDVLRIRVLVPGELHACAVRPVLDAAKIGRAPGDRGCAGLLDA